MLKSRQTTNEGSRVPSRKRKQKFNPDHEYCRNATEEYLKNGGKIDRQLFNPAVYGNISSSDCSADEFLMG